MESIPLFWKNSLAEIDSELQKVRRGQVEVLGQSAGGRDIFLVTYGGRSELEHRANYNSACGAGDPHHYARKGLDQRPVVLIVGGIHGGELEGVTAVLNLIRVLETGEDYRGSRYDELMELHQRFRLLLIPCMNPDGRARVPLRSLAGLSMDQMRYYMQGTWKDGSLCEWPACKAVHPIRDHVSFLGSYFNDDGINLMHDNFFRPMAEETKSLMALVDRQAVDASVLLHGGGNCTNLIMPLRYAPKYIQKQQHEFAVRLKEASFSKGLKFAVRRFEEEDGSAYPPPAFNLTSALHHLSGGLSMTYESNMGLDAPGEQYTFDEILESHFILFEELLRYQSERSAYGEQ